MMSPRETAAALSRIPIDEARRDFSGMVDSVHSMKDDPDRDAMFKSGLGYLVELVAEMQDCGVDIWREEEDHGDGTVPETQGDGHEQDPEGAEAAPEEEGPAGEDPPEHPLGGSPLRFLLEQGGEEAGGAGVDPVPPQEDAGEDVD